MDDSELVVFLAHVLGFEAGRVAFAPAVDIPIAGTVAGAATASYLAAGDLNKDGRDDLVASGARASDKVSAVIPPKA